MSAKADDAAEREALNDNCPTCETARLEARVRELEGELGLVLEYFERGVPYWHGTSPKDRLRAVLAGKESPLLARVRELKAALPRESWFSATLAHYNGVDDSYPITMPMTKGDVRRIRDALQEAQDG